MTMHMTPKSSNIAGVEYFPTTKQMVVMFHGPKLYLYNGVDAVDVSRILFAKSIGATFAKWLNGGDAARDVRPISSEYLGELHKASAERGDEPFTPVNPDPGGDRAPTS